MTITGGYNITPAPTPVEAATTAIADQTLVLQAMADELASLRRRFASVTSDRMASDDITKDDRLKNLEREG